MLAGIVALQVGCDIDGNALPPKDKRDKELRELNNQYIEKENRLMEALGNAYERKEDGESYEHQKKRLAQDKEDKKKALLKNTVNSTTPPLPRNVSMPACPH